MLLFLPLAKMSPPSILLRISCLELQPCLPLPGRFYSVYRKKADPHNDLISRHLKSGSIRLRVGENEYMVHRSLLFENLQNIDISAHERIIDFEGDEDIVACLLEFLYTSDYNPEVEGTPSRSSEEALSEEHVPGDQKSSQQGAEQEVHPIVLAARSSGLGVWGRPAAVHTKRWEETRDTSTDHPAATAGRDPSQTETSSAGHRAEDDAKKEAKNAASAVPTHAKVYLLAEKYGYSALMKLALQKLRATLKTSELEVPTDHTTSLVTLIKSVYSHPVDEENQGHESKQRQLRDVVITQTADKLPMLQANGDFKAFLKDGSDFAGDLLNHLAKTQLTLRG